jgi:hypothetical protein
MFTSNKSVKSQTLTFSLTSTMYFMSTKYLLHYSKILPKSMRFWKLAFSLLTMQEACIQHGANLSVTTLFTEILYESVVANNSRNHDHRIGTEAALPDSGL